VENNENWNALGEVTGLNTNEKLDYQMGYQNFQIEDHFNNEDYCVLEWRFRNETANVRKIYHKKSLRIFTLRNINLDKFHNDPSDLHNELRTLSILSQHPHKNILRLISSRMLVSSENSPDYKNDFQFYTEVKGNDKAVSMSVSIVTEFGVANLKELMKLRKKLDIPWQENELLILLKEIASPLAHCESLGIAHRNVKPSNIFFGEDKLTLKLVDFKLSLLLDKRQRIIETNVVGTPRYMSYELKMIYNELKKNKKKQISVKYDPYLSDVSSLGLIILEIILTSMGIDKEMKLEAEFAEEILEQTAEQYPYISKILRGILNNDPKLRPRFSEIEKLLQMPEEKLRKEAYENRFHLMNQLNRSKREEGIYTKNDLQQEFLNTEVPRGYHRLALSELTPPPLDSKKKSSSPKPKSKKDSQTKKNENANKVAKESSIESIYKDDTIDVLSLCYEKARKQGDYQSALKLCLYLKEIFEKLHKNLENPIFVYLLNNIGQMNYYLHNYQESIDIYMQAYKISKKIYGENKLCTAILLNNAGNLYYSTKQESKAKDLYQKSMRIKETLGMKEKFTYAVALHNMANIRFSDKKIQAAEEWFQSALKIYTQESEKPGVEVAELYLALSMLYYAYLDNRVKGEEYINLAFDIFEEIDENEMKKNLVGTAYYHLGVLHYCFKEYPEACEAYSEALALLESATSKRDEIIQYVKDHLRLIRNEAQD